MNEAIRVSLVAVDEYFASSSGTRMIQGTISKLVLSL